MSAEIATIVRDIKKCIKGHTLPLRFAGSAGSYTYLLLAFLLSDFSICRTSVSIRQSAGYGAENPLFSKSTGNKGKVLEEAVFQMMSLTYANVSSMQCVRWSPVFDELRIDNDGSDATSQSYVFTFTDKFHALVDALGVDKTTIFHDCLVLECREILAQELNCNFY